MFNTLLRILHLVELLTHRWIRKARHWLIVQASHQEGWDDATYYYVTTRRLVRQINQQEEQIRNLDDAVNANLFSQIFAVLGKMKTLGMQVNEDEFISRLIPEVREIVGASPVLPAADHEEPAIFSPPSPNEGIPIPTTEEVAQVAYIPPKQIQEINARHQDMIESLRRLKSGACTVEELLGTQKEED